MDTFDQTKAGCFIFDISAYTLRSKSRFEAEVLNGTGVKVEGLYTTSRPTDRYKGNDVYYKQRATLLLDDIFLPATFIDMQDVHVHFYNNTNNISCMISLIQMHVNYPIENVMIQEIQGEKGKKNIETVAFATNTLLPDLEMMAPKLVAE